MEHPWALYLEVAQATLGPREERLRECLRALMSLRLQQILELEHPMESQALRILLVQRWRQRPISRAEDEGLCATYSL